MHCAYHTSGTWEALNTNYLLSSRQEVVEGTRKEHKL